MGLMWRLGLAFALASEASGQIPAAIKVAHSNQRAQSAIRNPQITNHVQSSAWILRLIPILMAARARVALHFVAVCSFICHLHLQPRQTNERVNTQTYKQTSAECLFETKSHDWGLIILHSNGNLYLLILFVFSSLWPVNELSGCR